MRIYRQESLVLFVRRGEFRMKSKSKWVTALICAVTVLSFASCASTNRIFVLYDADFPVEFKFAEIALTYYLDDYISFQTFRSTKKDGSPFSKGDILEFDIGETELAAGKYSADMTFVGTDTSVVSFTVFFNREKGEKFLNFSVAEQFKRMTEDAENPNLAEKPLDMRSGASAIVIVLDNETDYDFNGDVTLELIIQKNMNSFVLRPDLCSEYVSVYIVDDIDFRFLSIGGFNLAFSVKVTDKSGAEIRSEEISSWVPFGSTCRLRLQERDEGIFLTKK